MSLVTPGLIYIRDIFKQAEPHSSVWKRHGLHTASKCILRKYLQHISIKSFVGLLDSHHARILTVNELLVF